MADKVHPVVRVFCFITFAFFIALGTPAQLGIGLMLVVLLYAFTGGAALKMALPMLRRMRWFFLSIALLYLFMAPDNGSVWGMSAEGIEMALYRISVLVVMVLAVCWLLHHTTRQELVSALYRIVWPLTLCGLSRERFAVRTVLALETIDQVQYAIAEQARHVSEGDSRIRSYAKNASNIFHEVLSQADAQPVREIELNALASPTVIQWGWLLLLVALMLLPILF